MADALISPAVGGTTWAAAAGLIGYSSRRLRDGMDDRRIPLMAVLGAFIFAAQMVNFTIPATGSSGHLGGGLILAALLGPYAGFLTMASVLIIQAFFFADGGLLAMGCNIINLGFFPCMVAYPLLYRNIAGDHARKGLIAAGAVTAAVAGLQLGSLGVVTQTVLSGISDLSFRTFLLVMQPIHLAIGLVEGMATAAVILFVMKARPEILSGTDPAARSSGILSMKMLAGLILAAALITGGWLSWYSSNNPDGLEWSLMRAAGTDRPAGDDGPVHRSLSKVQERTAILPDYGAAREGEEDPGGARETGTTAPDSGQAAKTFSGIVGGAMTFLLAGALWLILRRRTPHLRGEAVHPGTEHG